MHTTRTTPTSDPRTSSVIRLVLAYEDFEAGKRAQRACQQLAPPASPDTAVNLDSWKFDLLKLPSMRTMAAQAVAGSDLVILAPHDGETLPCFVLEWIRLTLRHSATRPKGLLLLMGLDPEDQEPLLATKHPLKELAARSGIPFWCLHPEAPNDAWEEPGYAPGELERVAQAIFPRYPAAAVPLQPGVLTNLGG